MIRPVLIFFLVFLKFSNGSTCSEKLVRSVSDLSDLDRYDQTCVDFFLKRIYCAIIIMRVFVLENWLGSRSDLARSDQTCVDFL